MSPRRPGLDPGAAAAASYRRSKVMGSTPIELVLMLYESLLADLEGAALAMRSGDIEAKAVRLQRANEVIFELLSALDHERGGEVSQRLAALYTYMIARVAEASRTRDPSILAELSRHVEGLLGAWRTAAEQQREPETAAPVGPS